MFDGNLARLADLKREDALKDAAVDRMLRDAGIVKGLGFRRFFTDMAKEVRAFFSRTKGIVIVNRRDLTPCPECP